MELIDSILKINGGAKFIRADLHIHTYGRGGSYDVTDSQMTPRNVVDRAVAYGLSMISITDHNNIGNIEEAIQYSSNKGLIVIPGIEISTIQGHLLVYSETIEQLSKLVGKLDISSDKRLCSQGIVACLKIAKQWKCFGVLAHIEDDAGFEKTINRFGPQMEEIFKQENLLGLEIKYKNSKDFYTSKDIVPERKKLAETRISVDDNEIEYELPKLMSSDAHTIERIGINEHGEPRLTRIKVNELSYESLRIALLSSYSRVRIEESIPERIPHIVGIKFEGGLLTDQIVNLNNNLTCIIGGRGTGKSTLLESIRIATGNISNSKLIDSEIWPEKISLVYQNETGKNEVFIRNKYSEVINSSDPTNGITRIPIESYGQGETADTIQHSDKDPRSLLNLLDTFIEIDAYIAMDNELRDRLFENQNEINKLLLDVNNIPEIKKLKLNIDKKLEVLKKEKVGDIVKYQESLIKERQFRANLIDDLKALVKKYREIFSDTELFQSVEELDGSSIIVGKQQFSEVKKIINEFAEIVSKSSSELQKELDDKIKELNIQLKSWKSAENEIQKKIDEKKKELEEGGIPFDLGMINKMAKDTALYEGRLKQLLIKQKKLQTRIKERNELLSSRMDNKNKLYYERNNLAQNLNSILKDTLSDLYISIKFKQGLYSPNFQEYLKTVLDYRTSQVPKAKIIVDNISPFRFIEIINNKEESAIEGLKDSEENKIFTKADTQKIFEKFSERDILSNVETVEFEDKPEILVTKEILKDGQSHYVTRDFSQLSLGQQQSILLAILLHSKSKNPLVIDQPEDNLDSEFIYKTIVKNLRKIKENRQVIIVTHNPNIAVLGDAELILPLKSTSNKTYIINRGAIDNENSKKITCDILEGGARAFKMRKDIYGI